MPEIAFAVRKAKPCPQQGCSEEAWREALAKAAQRAREQAALTEPTASTRFTLRLRFRMRESARAQASDLDNLAKPAMDTLFLSGHTQKPKSRFSGVLFRIDDAQVFRLQLEKTQVCSADEEGVDVRVVWQ